jgi:hypothetical protein
MLAPVSPSVSFVLQGPFSCSWGDNKISVREMAEQVVTNLRTCVMIDSLAIERGFMDGKSLWWPNKNGIIFCIPGKAGMTV